MKVLFAIGSTSSSEEVKRQYSELYDEKLEGKDVFYFKAILEEVKRDKSYDRIVIAEQLEPMPSNIVASNDQIIFNNIDSITDEIPNAVIIFICSDNRTKGDALMSRLFNIGIYNILMGDERQPRQLCNLIREPRTKREAKLYLNNNPAVDGTSVITQDEGVDERELLNILNYFDRLRTDEEYVNSFVNVAEQYNDEDLTTIVATLTKKLKRGGDVYNALKADPRFSKYCNWDTGSGKQKSEGGGIFGILKGKKNTVSNASSMREKVNNLRKEKERESFERLETKPDAVNPIKDESTSSNDFFSTQTVNPIKDESAPNNNFFGTQTVDTQPIIESNQSQEDIIRAQQEAMFKAQQEAMFKAQQEAMLKAQREAEAEKSQEDIIRAQQEAMLKAQQEAMQKAQQEAEAEKSQEDIIRAQQEAMLKAQQEAMQKAQQEAMQESTPEDPFLQKQEEMRHQEEERIRQQQELLQKQKEQLKAQQEALKNDLASSSGASSYSYDYNDRQEAPSVPTNTDTKESNSFSAVPIQRNVKKVIALVGTNKVGTSFMANVLGTVLASKGVRTAILDITKTRGLYWFYGDETLKRKDVVSSCMSNLSNGIASPVHVGKSKNLDLYTTIPGGSEDNRKTYKHRSILDTAKRSCDILIIDCDFSTPYEYFEQAQEVYVVQDLDLLKVQETISFFRELKSNQIDWSKLKLVMNNCGLKSKINAKTIIKGALKYYNDPNMTYTEDFEEIKQYVEFEMDPANYANYLDSMENGNLNIDKFTPSFKKSLNDLVGMVYGIQPKRKGLFG